jgi:cytidyltransferase-like protein
MKVVVVSGGFDPLHSGHIAYFQSAKKLGDKLVVALNSDDWLIKKKEKFFMPFTERKIILENIKVVDEVIDFSDDEKGSCIEGLKKISQLFPNDEIIFANGGDRNQENIPEMELDNIEFVFSVGGDDKKNSSSWILKNFSYDFEERVWGKFFNLFTDDAVKVKELIIDPKKGLSFQRHFYRSEVWFVSKGACDVNYSEGTAEDAIKKTIKKDETIFIKKEAWHQIINPYDQPCHIIEIQYGDKTIEDDIERLYYHEE